MNFYGYQFEVNKSPSAIKGDGLIELLKSKQSLRMIWMDEFKEHVWSFYTDTGARVSVYYPSIKSIQYRINLASELGCGISIWEIGQGLTYFYDLL